MKKSLTLLLLFCSVTLLAQNDIRSIYGRAMEAYQAKDFETFLRDFKTLDSLSPMHPTITYNLGAAYALTGNKEQAIFYGQKAVRMNSSLIPETDDDYRKSFSPTDSLEFVKLRQELNLPVKNGVVAFTNSETDLHPESLAFDPASGHFFLNSVRKGKILRYNPETKSYSEFATGRWAVMGMKVYKDQLWACEVATNEHEGFDEGNKGKTAVLQYDIKSGKLMNRYELEAGHWFGDLLFSKSGQVFISDSQQPIIYTIKDNKLSVFRDFTDELYNLQGLAFNKDESLLYIADYKIGLQVMDLKTLKVTPVLHSNEIITKGSDGIYFYKGSLICIQNGVNPFRVTQYKLDSKGTTITEQKHLDKARAELKEPTLGVVIGDALYYVANSPWGAYKDGAFITEGLGDNLVIKVGLDK